MNLKSLGRKTDLIFSRFEGQVIDRGDYIVIKTPSNPNFYWGNFIIFSKEPKPGDFKLWKSIFDEEFDSYSGINHYTFTWDTDEKGVYDEFLKDGFEFDSGVVLTTERLVPPQYKNDLIKIRKIESEKSWKEVIELQVKCADPKFLNDHYREFKEAQFRNYKTMSDAGKGYWFGAYIDEVLVADLGIFFEGEVARYQSVETDPKFRKQGICANLVYQVGQFAFEKLGVKTLVMEADPNYHAARIYESVGFQKTEINHGLCWWLKS